MIAITDANIIVSALINPKSIIASILKDEKKFQFIAPDFLITEIKKHWSKIEDYSVLTKKELKDEWKYYLNRIKFFSIDDISGKHIDQAVKIVNDIDRYDFAFVATYLHTKHKIWTGDKVLIEGVEAKGYKIFIT